MAKKTTGAESCAVCGCPVHRSGEYAKPTVQGRSHATAHHHVAERFFGRSATRRGATRERIFETCPWDSEGKASVFCFECHEELLHNPVLLPDDVARFAALVRAAGLAETEKPGDRTKLAGRIKLLHDVIDGGLRALESRSAATPRRVSDAG